MENYKNIESINGKEKILEKEWALQSNFEKDKTPEQEAEEIDRQILETKDWIEKEKKNLAEIRMKLGLSGEEEESASIKAYKEKIQGLLEKKASLEKNVVISGKLGAEKENKTEKKEEFEKIKPQEFGDFITATKKLSSFFQERDSQRLSSLVEDPAKIRGAIGALESSLSSQNPDTESVARAISIISESINEIGERQAQGAIRENPESLAKLAFLLTNMDKERYALGGRVSKKENVSGVLSALNRIESVTKNKKAAIYRKLDLLKQYGGR